MCAVHQYTRFTHGTKHSHEKAALQICKYLKGTQNDRLIVSPSKDLQINCFADADFIGLYRVEDHQDTTSVKSRAGYVLTFVRCPIQWVSKLQTKIALSMLHGEYVALTQSLGNLLHVKALITELMAGMGTDMKKLEFVSKST
eukprot:15332305-Ditylum_brightwellii.AAC.2